MSRYDEDISYEFQPKNHDDEWADLLRQEAEYTAAQRAESAGNRNLSSMQFPDGAIRGKGYDRSRRDYV